MPIGSSTPRCCTQIVLDLFVGVVLFQERQKRNEAVSAVMVTTTNVTQWRHVAKGVVVIVKRKPQLLEIICALHATCGFTRLLDRRQQQSNQHTNNRDDNEQFDKRKGFLSS